MSFFKTNSSKSFLIVLNKLSNSSSHRNLFDCCTNSKKSSLFLINTNSKRVLNIRRLKSTDISSNPVQGSSGGNPQKSSFLKNGLKYFITIGLGTSAGLLTGYYLMLDQFKPFDNQNEAVRSFLPNDFNPTKLVEYKDSVYRDFPISIHLYQYQSCPYCSQIRAYLDYFGFSYKVTEVDGYDKAELTSFTKARMLPILVLEDKVTKHRLHLSNATAILSALESVRNEKHIHFEETLNQYLPTLMKNSEKTKNPNKYNVTNNSLNSIEWRKWINNVAMPVFKYNSIVTLKDLIESFDYYSEKSSWKLRYNKFKYLYVYYYRAYRTYNLRSSLQKQIETELGGSNKSARELLNDTINKWEDGLGNNLFISGTNKPDLADLSMFGNVKAFEGCSLFRDSIAKHPAFRSWYERMQLVVSKRYQPDIEERKKSPSYFLISLADDLSRLEEEEKNEKKQVEYMKLPKFDLSQIEVFRILTVNYLFHIVVFTYAAWMSR